MSPNTTFTIAAINDEVMLVIKAFLTFSFMISATKSPDDIFSEYTSTDANGMRTMTESIVTTIPSERWYPGMTLVFMFFDLVFSFAVLSVAVYFIEHCSIIEICLVGFITSAVILYAPKPDI